MHAADAPDLELQQLLMRRLDGLPGSIVAFSGGVDSSYLLWAAVRVLGTARVRAVLGTSASVPQVQIAQAERVAQAIGIPLMKIATSEVEDARYRANAGDRCFFCKDTLFRSLGALDVPSGWAILDGTNRDDLGGHRPGRAAAEQHAIQSPLADAGLTKAAIRRLSKAAGLPTADLPSSPCLASRFPAGVPVDEQALHRVEAAEAVVRALGFDEFRVRHHGDVARIEIPERDFARITSPGIRTVVASRLRALGYRFVSLDLEGFASGRGSTL